jgi:S-adenosylmethionine hydrolase
VIITLTTDFGHRDGFVGAMKGVRWQVPRGTVVEAICAPSIDAGPEAAA